MENLLDRIPNVSAQNGSIKVFGRGEAVIYINGRQMRGRSELDRLRSDNIKSVEVIMINGDSYDNISTSLNLQPTIGFWHPSFSALLEKQWFKMVTREGNRLDKPIAMLRFDNTFDTKLAMFSIMMTYITKGHERNIYVPKTMFNTDLSIYKSILHDRLSLQLYVSDLFGTNDDHSVGIYGYTAS